MGTPDRKNQDADWLHRWSRRVGSAMQHGWPPTRDWVKRRNTDALTALRLAWPPTRDWVIRSFQEWKKLPAMGKGISVIAPAVLLLLLIVAFSSWGGGENSAPSSQTNAPPNVPPAISAEPQPARPKPEAVSPDDPKAPTVAHSKSKSPRADKTLKRPLRTQKSSRQPTTAADTVDEPPEIQAAKAALKSRSYFPSRIHFAQASEWKINSGTKETTVEGWVEQSTGLRNNFSVAISNGYKQQSDTLPRKVWIRSIKLDNLEILKYVRTTDWEGFSIDGKRAFARADVRYDPLLDDWRMDWPGESKMLYYNHETRKIETQDR